MARDPRREARARAQTPARGTVRLTKRQRWLVVWGTAWLVAHGGLLWLLRDARPVLVGAAVVVLGLGLGWWLRFLRPAWKAQERASPRTLGDALLMFAMGLLAAAAVSAAAVLLW